MKSRRSGDLTQGPLLRHSLSFGLPLALALMGHGLFNLVDLVIVGQLDEGAVAAVTVSGIVLTVAFLLFDGISNVIVALVAHAHGAHQRRMVHDVAWESFGLAALCGVLGALVFTLLATPVFSWFTFQSQVATAEGVAYTEVMAWGLITMFLMMQSTAVLRGMGDSKWPMIILVGANFLNIVLDILLVFGYWGFPKLGVVGAAWATVIARGLGALLGMWLLWSARGHVRLSRIPFRRPIKYVRTLLSVGLPTSVQLAGRVLVVFFLLKLAEQANAGHGPAENLVAGVGICIRLEMVAVFLGCGWGAAATTLVGQNLGAMNPRRASRGSWIMVLLGALSMGLVGLLIWVFRWPLIEIIKPGLDARAMAAAQEYLSITIPFYPVLGLALVLSRALNGATSTRTPMVIDLVMGFFVMLPLAAWFSGVGLFGFLESSERSLAGVWWGEVTGYLLAGLVFSLVFLKGRWRKKKMLTG